MTYAIDHAADVAPGPIDQSFEGLRFEVRSPRGPLRIASRLVGRPNVYNILAAAAAAHALDLPTAAIERGLADVALVPGRFQVVSGPADDVQVVVDYAHTDDALRNLLETARPLAAGRLVTVFGCGGDRDRTKRPLMGAVAARLSDVVVVTSDNPRSEDPEAIVAEIKRGITPPADRAGKGGGRRPSASPCSTGGRPSSGPCSWPGPATSCSWPARATSRYQVIGDRALPFDDVEVARAALARRRAGSAVP